jgi:N-acetylneuraminic acid mutarotase
MQPSVYGLDEIVVWENTDPSTAPSARRFAGMAYDSGSDLVVLFSGGDPDLPAAFGDTWTFDVDTNIWTNVTPEDSPPPRGTLGGFEYDSDSDRVIFYGGVKQLEPFVCWDDTWAFNCDTETWENRTPASSPRGTALPAMAYDSGSDRIIMYGGMWDDRDVSSETWSYHYDSNTWTNMSPDVSPGLLYAFGFAYDSESDRVILFGGKYRDDTGEEIKDETWSYNYDTNTWTKMNPPVKPAPRERFQMTYHAGWDRIVLFGGDKDYFNPLYDETWLYDFNNDNWTQLSLEPHPTGRVYAGLAYDNESECIVLFGGMDAMMDVFGDTWTLSNTTPSTPLPLPEWWWLVLGAGAVVLVLVAFVYVRKQ